MLISVIVTTYNSPDWLEKVLWGYSVQTFSNFELLIADDGSTAETAERIATVRDHTGLNLRHVWQERQGFRKCTILNKAITDSGGDYLIFSDGDCVPRNDFVEAHVMHARLGRFLSGGALRLPMELSQKISRNDIVHGRHTRLSWLLKNGLGWNKQGHLLLGGKYTGRVLDLLTTTRPTWNGGNASAFRSDLFKVNGYDERMEHGGLDRELGERLVNAGVEGMQLRHRAVCVHLDHPRGYVRAEAKVFNAALRQKVREEKLTWTDYGLAGDRKAA